MPMSGAMKKKKTGYDKYVDLKKLSLAIAAFILILLLPIPDSMVDVAVEYTAARPMCWTISAGRFSTSPSRIANSGRP